MLLSVCVACGVAQVREGKRPADWQKLAVAGKYTLPEGSLTPPKL